MQVRMSATGPAYKLLQYAPASSGPWVDVATFASSKDSVFDPYVIPMPVGASNLAIFCFRIVSIFQPGTLAYQSASQIGGGSSTYGTGGTLRIDNLAGGLKREHALKPRL